MADSCSIQTPDERQRGAIIMEAETALLDKVFAALKEAEETASAALRGAGMEAVPPLHDYFAASVHQKLYCILCGADPKTFSGGNAKTAIAVIRNSQQIARHYWGADIDPYPRP
jgi:hypothetical protein